MKKTIVAVCALLGAIAGSQASASTTYGLLSNFSGGYGNYGITTGVDGSINSTAYTSPGYSNGASEYISTYTQNTGNSHGDSGALPSSATSIPDPTNGSSVQSSLLSLSKGQSVSFAFDFLTTDTGYSSTYYPDYSWAALYEDDASTGNSASLVGYLFTAEAWSGGARVDAGVVNSTIGTVTQPTASVVTYNPTFSQLGPESGQCWSLGNGSAGCGYTGWSSVSYAVASTGSYFVTFGVTNVGDKLYDSALAIANLVVSGTASGAQGGGSTVPEPWTLALLLSGLTAAAMVRKRTAL
jgi:hypothetical protein